MPTNNDSDELLGLTEKIVSAHVGNNAIASADLPELIRAVYAALGNLAPAVAPMAPLMGFCWAMDYGVGSDF